MGSVWQRSPCAAHQTLERPLFFSERAKKHGPQCFNREWLSRYLEQITTELTGQDIKATLAELTALTIADAVSKARCQLRASLWRRSPEHSFDAAARSSSPRAWASAMFRRTNGILGYRWRCGGGCGTAWLAYRRHYLLPGNMPEVTGANGARVLGAIYQVKSACAER